jgi:predicted amidophosphoribosyltransferase
VIFINKTNNRPNQIMYLGEYYPYWRRGHQRNPNFDDFSNWILELKKNSQGAIQYFYNQINLFSSGFVIAVVPSHDPNHTASGVTVLAKKLASNRRIDATSCLFRHEKIEKLAHGGQRNIQIHLDSIRCRYANLIKSHEVLLLDDVTTSNNSLNACKKILLDNGARLVQAFALAQTTH